MIAYDPHDILTSVSMTDLENNFLSATLNRYLNAQGRIFDNRVSKSQEALIRVVKRIWVCLFVGSKEPPNLAKETERHQGRRVFE